jgi:hypothetical protein
LAREACTTNKQELRDRKIDSDNEAKGKQVEARTDLRFLVGRGRAATAAGGVEGAYIELHLGPSERHVLVVESRSICCAFLLSHELL